MGRLPLMNSLGPSPPPHKIPKYPHPKTRNLMGMEVFLQKWETDFYTPPVLGGAALLPFSAPAVYKNLGP